MRKGNNGRQEGNAMHHETWRTLLAAILEETPQEKPRIAKALRINPVTLTRWTKTDGEPRLFLLPSLVKAVPEQYRARMRSLLEEDFPGFWEEEGAPLREDATLPLSLPEERSLSMALAALLKSFEEGQMVFAETPSPSPTGSASEDIAAGLYGQVLRLHTSVRPDERFWSVCECVLPPALLHLDPGIGGMELLVVRCMPPSKGKVQSLLESLGVGTPPWKPVFEEHHCFLGAESLAGYVVTSRQVAVAPNRGDDHLLPTQAVSHTQSSAALPIGQGDRVAGALLCSTTHVAYFTASRLELLQKYANLLSLAFFPHEFYPTEAIELRVMPAITVQHDYFTHYHEQVIQEMEQADQAEQPLTVVQAQLAVHRRIEGALAQLLPGGKAVPFEA